MTATSDNSAIAGFNAPMFSAGPHTIAMTFAGADDIGGGPILNHPGMTPVQARLAVTLEDADHYGTGAGQYVALARAVLDMSLELTVMRDEVTARLDALDARITASRAAADDAI